MLLYFFIKQNAYIFKIKYPTDVHILNTRSKGLLSPLAFRLEIFRQTFSFQMRGLEPKTAISNFKNFG